MNDIAKQYAGEEKRQRKLFRKHCCSQRKKIEIKTLLKVAEIHGDPPKPKPERDPEPGPAIDDTRSASQPPDSQS